MDDETLLLELATQPDTGDADIADALYRICDAIAGIKTPEIPAFPQIDTAAIVKALANLGAIAGEVRSLRQDVSRLAEAIGGLSSPDVECVAAAIEKQTKTTAALVRALTAPKEIVFDTSGNPTGIRPVRVN